MIEQVTRHIYDLVPQWRGRHVDGVEFLSGGYSNDNYAFNIAGKRYVLRLPAVQQPFVDRAHEQHWYSRLPPQLSISPRVFDAKTGRMISAWVDGVLLIDAWPTLNQQQLLGYLGSLHGKMPEAGRDYDINALCQAYWQGVSPPQVAAVPAHLSASCHNDLNPWNVLVTSGGWITLDWEFVGRNDPLFDLVCLHQGLELPDETLIDLAVEYLRGDTGVTEHRLPRVLRSFWVRELGWATYQISHGNQRDEVREQAELAQSKLAQYPG